MSLQAFYCKLPLFSDYHNCGLTISIYSHTGLFFWPQANDRAFLFFTFLSMVGNWTFKWKHCCNNSWTLVEPGLIFGQWPPGTHTHRHTLLHTSTIILSLSTQPVLRFKWCPITPFFPTLSTFMHNARHCEYHAAGTCAIIFCRRVNLADVQGNLVITAFECLVVPLHKSVCNHISLLSFNCVSRLLESYLHSSVCLVPFFVSSLSIS